MTNYYNIKTINSTKYWNSNKIIKFLNDTNKFTYDECWRLGTRAVYTSPNHESEGYDIDVDLPK